MIDFSTYKIKDLCTVTSSKRIYKKEYTESGIPFYRGSENNVLSRYYNAAKSADADIIIRNTGDNPLVDPTIIDKLIQILMLEIKKNLK